MPVPPILKDWAEAQAVIDKGGRVLARGRFVGGADNWLIDCLPTNSCFTEPQYQAVAAEGRSVISKPDFITYCRQVNIDPRGLTVDYFLQKVVPRSEVRIITLDAGRGQIMVNCMEMGNPTE